MELDEEYRKLCEGAWRPPRRPADLIGARPLAWYRMPHEDGDE